MRIRSAIVALLTTIQRSTDKGRPDTTTEAAYYRTVAKCVNQVDFDKHVIANQHGR